MSVRNKQCCCGSLPLCLSASLCFPLPLSLSVRPYTCSKMGRRCTIACLPSQGGLRLNPTCNLQLAHSTVSGWTAI